VRERLTFRIGAALGEAGAQRAVMARAAGSLYAAAATIVLLSLAVPEDELDATPVAIVLAAVAGYALAAGMIAGQDRLPLWVHHAGLLGLTAVITAAIYYSGGLTTFAVFYLWTAVFAFYFFPLALAAAHVAIAAAAYALVLDLRDVSQGGSRWTITVAGLLATGLVMSQVKALLGHLISRLSTAATTDPLTGLLNRRGLGRVFDRELERSRRGGRPLGVLVGDLDRFKQLNDRFGHAAGDQALERVAAILAGRGRRIDVAARWGGEEFALLVPDADENASYLLAERLRREVRAAFQAEREQLTISFGIASFPRDGETPEELLQAADRALYYGAKELGRDCSVVYSPSIAEVMTGAASRQEAQSQVHLATALSLAEALDIRDSGSVRHSQGVGRYAEMIARALALPPGAVERLRLAGVIHDIGKLSVPEAVRHKPGPLTDEEWDEMKRHPETAARMLEDANLEDIRGWVLAHHERPDGEGYPLGLTRDTLPLEAKILAVAEAYETMTSDAPYRPAIRDRTARKELELGSGTQFDPRIVEVFLGLLREEDEAEAAAEAPPPVPAPTRGTVSPPRAP
jgi:diguanylate cyclase (GGDEF)-like protein